MNNTDKEMKRREKDPKRGMPGVEKQMTVEQAFAAFGGVEE